MTITLFTETEIDGAHYLRGYDGKCAHVHGHTWVLQIWIQGDEIQQDDVGILFDFGKIKEIKEMFDHKVLNEVPPFAEETLLLGKKLWANPTAENVAIFVLKYLEQYHQGLSFRVRLYETAVSKRTYCQVQSHRFDSALV